METILFLWQGQGQGQGAVLERAICRTACMRRVLILQLQGDLAKKRAPKGTFHLKEIGTREKGKGLSVEAVDALHVTIVKGTDRVQLRCGTAEEATDLVQLFCEHLQLPLPATPAAPA